MINYFKMCWCHCLQFRWYQVLALSLLQTSNQKSCNARYNHRRYPEINAICLCHNDLGCVGFRRRAVDTCRAPVHSPVHDHHDPCGQPTATKASQLNAENNHSHLSRSSKDDLLSSRLHPTVRSDPTPSRVIALSSQTPKRRRARSLDRNLYLPHSHERTYALLVSYPRSMRSRPSE
jgi:hypothetical protein